MGFRVCVSVCTRVCVCVCARVCVCVCRYALKCFSCFFYVRLNRSVNMAYFSEEHCPEDKRSISSIKSSSK